MRRHYVFSAIVAVLAIAFTVFSCGGILATPYCLAGHHYCGGIAEGAAVCCPNTAVCGTDVNRCPRGECCPLADAPPGTKPDGDF